MDDNWLTNTVNVTMWPVYLCKSSAMIGCWVIVNISGQLLQGPHEADCGGRGHEGAPAHGHLHQLGAAEQDLGHGGPRQARSLCPGQGADVICRLCPRGVRGAWRAILQLLLSIISAVSAELLIVSLYGHFDRSTTAAQSSSYSIILPRFHSEKDGISEIYTSVPLALSCRDVVYLPGLTWNVKLWLAIQRQISSFMIVTANKMSLRAGLASNSSPNSKSLPLPGCDALRLFEHIKLKFFLGGGKY